MSTAITKEQTPIFDALIAEHGDPVVRPVLDRSYAKLAELAARSKRTAKLSAAKAKVAVGKNSDQDTDSSTDQVVPSAADTPADRAASPSPA